MKFQLSIRWSDSPAWLIAAAAFFAPIKPAPLNVFLALGMLTALMFANNRNYLLFVFRSGFGWWPLGFFALLCLLQAFSGTGWDEATEYLGKYARLAYIPLVAAALPLQADRERALQGFSLGMIVTLTFSYCIAFIPDFCSNLGMDGCGSASNPFVFKQHITHGFFMVLAVGVWGFWAWTRRKLAYAVLVVLGLVNLIGMIEGRTAWIVVIVLLLISSYSIFGALRTALFVSLTLFVAVPITLTKLPQSTMLVHAMDEYRQWAEVGMASGRSGMRLTYYSHALKAIKEAPIIGHGLGGTREALDLEKLEPKIYALNNPHNQYLLFAVQGGLSLLAAYLALQVFFYRNRNAWRGHTIFGVGFIAAYATGNLFNSFHFDMSEAVLYCIGSAALFSVPQDNKIEK